MTDHFAKKTGTIVPRVFSAPGKMWPVEVFDAKTFALKARGFSGEGISLEPGSYVVSARLPDGATAHSNDIVRLEPFQQLDVQVVLDAIQSSFRSKKGSRSPNLGSSWKLNYEFLHKDGSYPFLEVPTLTPSERTVPPPKQLTFELTAVDAGELTDKVAKAYVQPAAISTDRPTFALYWTKSDAFLAAIPCAWHESVTCEFSEDEEGYDILSYQFASEEGQQLWEMVRATMFVEARSSLHHVSAATTILSEKVAFPLSATLAAYVLLKANELTMLAKWSENLLYQVGTLDARIVHAETRARLGDHEAAMGSLEQAAKSIEEASHFEMPVFRSGVTYLLDRLESYAEFLGKDAPRARRFRAWQAEIDPLASILDSSATVCRYRLPVDRLAEKIWAWS